MEHQKTHVEEKGYNAYVPLPTTDDPPKRPPYTQEQEDRYPSQNQYEGGYQNQGYPPQGGYRNLGGGPEGQGFQNQGYASFGQGHQNQGYLPQEHAQIKQPGGSSFQSYNSTTEVVQNQNQPVIGLAPVMKFHYGLSICGMICCLPFGIIAYLKSTEAQNRYIARDYEGALESARSAKKFAVSALVAGSILYVLAMVPSIIIIATAQ